MDDTLQELENELKRLSPRRPSAGLVQAIGREIGAEAGTSPVPRYRTATSWRAWKWAGWSLAGVAAAVALAFFLQADRQPVKSPASVIAATAPFAPKPAEAPVNRYQPVRATSVLYDLKEDELTSLPDQTEGRQVRYRYVDTYTWQNPASKASLRWSVPRDEVRLVRASLD